MEKKKFVESEMVRFDENSEHPFRVAMSSDFNGSDYPYGKHTEVREYADNTIGWAQDRATAEKLLGDAWEQAESQNAQYWAE